MKSSKKLIGASVALVAALAVSVGTTYAWFTTNKKVSVENIQASVTTGDSNLEVALVSDKGEVGTFGYSLDLGSALSTTLANLKFDALTDNGALTSGSWAGSGKNGLALTNKAGETTNVTAASATAEGSYLQFTLRFRTTTATEGAKSFPLYLTDASTVTSTAEGTKITNIYASENINATDTADTVTIAKGSKAEAKAENAMRIAFHEAEVTLASGEGPANGSVAAKANTGKVWEPNADQGWGAATYTKNMAQLVEEQLTGATANSLAGLYKDPAYTALTPYSASATTNGQIVSMTEPTTKDGYFYADVQIIIWLEGTDEDCFNNIFDQKVTIGLNFQLGDAVTG